MTRNAEMYNPIGAARMPGRDQNHAVLFRARPFAPTSGDEGQEGSGWNGKTVSLGRRGRPSGLRVKRSGCSNSSGS